MCRSRSRLSQTLNCHNIEKAMCLQRGELYLVFYMKVQHEFNTHLMQIIKNYIRNVNTCNFAKSTTA